MGDRDIKEVIRKLAGQEYDDRVYTIDAEVLSVDEDNRTCECQSISGQASNVIPDVRLMASVDDGILILPAIGSNVTIILSTFTDPYVTGYSAIDKIILRGGDLGGLVKVVELTDKLNKIENLLNDFISKYNSHTHAGVQTGGGMSAVTLALEDQTLTLTEKEEIENEKITQG